jgi:hypothetical protein
MSHALRDKPSGGSVRASRHGAASVDRRGESPTGAASQYPMALRTTARTLLAAAGKDGAAPAAGLLQDIRKRVTTGKLLRPDVADDVLRQPVDEAKYRSPAPGYVQRSL